METREWYHKAFFNNNTRSKSVAFYDEIAVPESRKIAWDSLLKSFAKVDFKKAHNPLLFISGENDAFFAASFTKKIAGSYTDKNSKTDFKSFVGRSHFIAGEKNWEEVAGYVLNWIQNL
jgi:dienelactone hydrolase